MQFRENKLQFPRLIFIVIAIILMLQLLVYLPGGGMIWGLDNVSPYFDIGRNFDLALTKGGLLLNGPILFNLPVQLLVALGLPANIVSIVAWLLPLLLGLVGYSLLIRHLFKQRKHLSQLLILGLLLILGHLATIWTFSQPIMPFTSMFAAFPLLLYISIQVTDRGYKAIVLPRWNSILLMLGIIYLFTSSLNLFTFLLLIAQLLLLTVITQTVLTSPEVKDKVRLSSEVGNTLIRSSVLASALLLVWLILLQGLSWGIGSGDSVISSIFDLRDNLQESTITEISTDDLRSSEIANNSLLNSSRFATGWMEIHDSGNIPLFNFYDLYMNNWVFKLIGLIPLISASILMAWSIRRYREWPNLWVLPVSFFAAVLLSSRYTTMLTDGIPLIEDLTRWISSKLTPGLLYFSLLSFLVVVDDLFERSNTSFPLYRFARFFKIGLLSLLLIGALPWLSKDFFSRGVVSELPPAYFKLQELDPETTILYYPPPEVLYFREYEWGYYGSSFLQYIIRNPIVDYSSISDLGLMYWESIEAYDKCDFEKLSLLGIDLVLHDKSTVSVAELICDTPTIDDKGSYLLIPVK